MNIISGQFRRRSLVFPNDRLFRPTKSIVRESVFNMIGDRIVGASFLDLCSGSGAIGLEAESRGAASVTCVDRYVKYLRLNKDALKAKIDIVRSDISRYLTMRTDPFDFIYLDPVWADHDTYRKSMHTIFDRQLLSSNGWLLVEHDQSFDPVSDFSQYLVKQVQYGNSRVSILTVG